MALDRDLISYAVSELDIAVPKRLIAQSALSGRDEARLLVLYKESGKTEGRVFKDICGYFREGDVLVLNRTRVIPAKIKANKRSGGKVEILFLKSPGPGIWRVITKPKLPVGAEVCFKDGSTSEICGFDYNGEALLKTRITDPLRFLEESGEMPLPPYIKRNGDNDLSGKDAEDYQTVYADVDGSVAAPTAGLHFTGDLLKKLSSLGVEIVKICLHVGWGTFKPIRCEDAASHKMLPEDFEIPETSASSINRAHQKGGRVFAVGTTVVRALESAVLTDGRLQGSSGSTEIFIYPGFKFRVVDALITNFHLSRHTPIFMAAAFAGRDNIIKAYEKAVRERYRFYSYGDAMLIL